MCLECCTHGSLPSLDLMLAFLSGGRGRLIVELGLAARHTHTQEALAS